MLEDVNSGAVYCDIILEYSTEAVLLMLKPFLSVRMSSDPGSQLKSAAGKMSLCWSEMKDSMMEVAGKYNFFQFNLINMNTL